MTLTGSSAQLARAVSLYYDDITTRAIAMCQREVVSQGTALGISVG